MMTRTTGRAGQQQARDGTDGSVNLGSSNGLTSAAGAYFLNMLLASRQRMPRGRDRSPARGHDVRSDCVVILLARSDTHGAVYRGHPDLSVADGPGAGMLGDGLHHGLNVLIVDEDVQADLGEQDGPRVTGQIGG